MRNRLDILLESLLEARLASFSDDVDLIEESIANRSMSALLLERMDSGDINALASVFDSAMSVLDDYEKAVKSINPTPPYLAKLINTLKKRLENRRKAFDKAKESDDIRSIVKYKDSVSDTGIMIVSALRTMRNTVSASSEMIRTAGQDAFKKSDEPGESQGLLGDFENLSKKAFSDKSISSVLSPESLERFRSAIETRVEKPSVSNKLFRGLRGSKIIKVDGSDLAEELEKLTPESLENLDRAIKAADGDVQKATEVAEETSEELQDDSVEGENSDTTEEAPEVEAGQFYRYTTTRGADRIVRVENVLDNGNVQLRLVIFNGDKLTTGSNVFALKQEKLGERLTDQEVKDSFDTPGERVQSIVGNSETANSAIENLSDIPLDELVKAASQSGDKPKVSREQGLKAFSAMAQNPKEAAFLYATVRKAINQDVGYEMFESKQEVDTLDRWLTIAGIDKDENET